MALVSVGDYKDSVYYDEKRLAEVTDDQIAKALAVAEARFLRRTNRDRVGRWFEVRELAVTLHGTGLPEVRCPYPVLELVSVTVGEDDITDSVAINNGRFIYRTDGETFGDAPTSLAETVFCDIQVIAKFGDPDIERGEDLAPVVPDDVADCIMRMTWHHFRKERLVQDLSNDRRGPSASSQASDVARDRQVEDTIRDWTVFDASRGFDFR